MLDTPFSRPSLDTGGTLTALIRSVLDEIPFYAKLPIRVEDDASLQTHTGAKRWTPPARAKVWDVIVALARDAGQEAWFDRDTLVIRKPVNASADRTRIVIYGEHISTMELKTGIKPAQLGLAAYGACGGSSTATAATRSSAPRRRRSAPRRPVRRPTR